MESKPREWDLIQGEKSLSLLTLADGPKVETGKRVRVIEYSAYTESQNHITNLECQLIDSKKERDEARAQIAEMLKTSDNYFYAQDRKVNAERARSAKLVGAASNLMRNFSLQLEAQIHAPGFKHIRLEPTLIEALGEAIAEYSEGESNG